MPPVRGRPVLPTVLAAVMPPFVPPTAAVPVASSPILLEPVVEPPVTANKFDTVLRMPYIADTTDPSADRPASTLQRATLPKQYVW